MQIDKAGKGQRDGDSSTKPIQQLGNSEAQGGKRVLFQLQEPDVANPIVTPHVTETIIKTLNLQLS
jgi:hypothetical protein